MGTSMRKSSDTIFNKNKNKNKSKKNNNTDSNNGIANEKEPSKYNTSWGFQVPNVGTSQHEEFTIGDIYPDQFNQKLRVGIVKWFALVPNGLHGSPHIRSVVVLLFYHDVLGLRCDVSIVYVFPNGTCCYTERTLLG